MGKFVARSPRRSGLDAELRRPAPPSLDGFAADVTEDDGGDCGRPRQVPVRRTFIEYGYICQSPNVAITPDRAKTAPASLGISMRTAFDFWREDRCLFVRREHVSGQDLTFVSGPPGSTSSSGRNVASTMSSCAQEVCTPSAVSPGCVADFTPSTNDDASSKQSLPSVLYRLTPTSAKAAGYWIATTCGSTSPKRKVSSQDLSNRGDLDSMNGMAREMDEESNCSTDDGDSDDDSGICPVYSETATPPSVGSIAHGEGTCKRCCFFPKGRCNNGEACQFCHFSHEKRKTKNKKKSKKRRRGRRGSDHAHNPVHPGPQGLAYVLLDQQMMVVPSSIQATPSVSAPFYVQ